MPAPLRLRRPLAILALAILPIGGMTFPAHAADFPPDLPEWEHPAPPEPGAPRSERDRAGDEQRYPDLDCDPDILIWKRFCADCLSNRPLEHCSDPALR